MGLADDVAAATLPRGGTCTVGAVLRSRPDIADDLVALMADPLIYSTAIAAGLRANGARVQANAIQRHRRRACACP